MVGSMTHLAGCNRINYLIGAMKADDYHIIIIIGFCKAGDPFVIRWPFVFLTLKRHFVTPLSGLLQALQVSGAEEPAKADQLMNI